MNEHNDIVAKKEDAAGASDTASTSRVVTRSEVEAIKLARHLTAMGEALPGEAVRSCSAFATALYGMGYIDRLIDTLDLLLPRQRLATVDIFPHHAPPGYNSGWHAVVYFDGDGLEHTTTQQHTYATLEEAVTKSMWNVYTYNLGRRNPYLLAYFEVAGAQVTGSELRNYFDAYNHQLAQHGVWAMDLTNILLLAAEYDRIDEEFANILRQGDAVTQRSQVVQAALSR